MFFGALSADFGNVAAWQGLGSCALAPERYTAAIALCRRALALAPNDPGIMSNLGNALCRAQQFDEAERLLTKARELAPDALNPHYNLGLVYYCTGRADLAEASFTRALAIGPDTPALRGDLAHAVLKTGDLARGLDLLEVRWEAGSLTKNPIWDCGLPLWTGERGGFPRKHGHDVAAAP
jgi:Flp pilus assembly protein TadD